MGDFMAWFGCPDSSQFFIAGRRRQGLETWGGWLV